LTLLRPWRTLDSRPAGDFRIFTVRHDRVVSPRTDETHDFFVLDGADWINVIPVTGDGKIILVEQYRHGTASFTLEIPGGGVDRADSNREAAARRELREETGYDARELRHLGFVHPNPAIQSNRCDTYLATGCEKVFEQSFDPGEDIAVRIFSREEVRGLLASGAISHSLVVAAFALWPEF
jgi:ADP-ribose pyrophosphatase